MQPLPMTEEERLKVGNERPPAPVLQITPPGRFDNNGGGIIGESV